MSLKNGSNLEIIYRIFELSRSLSGNTEFTKVNTYNGLIKVYERLIKQSIITETEKNQLKQEI